MNCKRQRYDSEKGKKRKKSEERAKLYALLEDEDVKEAWSQRAKYSHDVLLCHDDELEGRRVAFILYFVPPWESSDGGTLDLFSTDDHFQPHSVVKSLVPSWNTLVLFEVSPVSFHQVSRAVFGATPSSHRAPLPKEPPTSQRLLLEWLNPLHLDVDYQSQVQQELEDS